MNPDRPAAADLAFCSRLSAAVASGITGRGPSALCRPEFWLRALALMSGKKLKIAVVSGFYVPAAAAPETDGPPGALVLARALRALGHDAEVWTDSLCLDCMRRGARVLNVPESAVVDVSDTLSEVPAVDLLVYLERLGRAADGAYYNMRGEDISQWTPALDSFALSGVPVVGIGDGGNEVGMGSLLGPLSGMMPAYAPCLCVVPADVCIPVDVSNWGGYALAALLSRSAGRWLGQTDEEERALLEALREGGAVDGVSRERSLSVDGRGLDEQLRVLGELRALFAGDQDIF